MTPSSVLHGILNDLNLITGEEADRAITHIVESRPLGTATVGIAIGERHYIISVEDMSS